MPEPIDPDAVSQYELATWTRCAESYLDHFAGLTRETIDLLRDAANVQPGSEVLDVGCGPGHVAGALVESGADVTGIDFSTLMIDVARRRFPAIRFQQADAEELPFADASFDAIVSNFVVHHLARPDVVFGEVRRVLRPGGRFAFVVFDRPEAQSSIGVFFDAVAAHHDMDDLPHGPLFGAESSAYLAPLRAAGLTDVGFETRAIVWRSADVDTVLRAFLEWGNTEVLPEGVRRRIADTARENLEQFKDRDGYAFPHAVLVGRAGKPEAA